MRSILLLFTPAPLAPHPRRDWGPMRATHAIFVLIVAAGAFDTAAGSLAGVSRPRPSPPLTLAAMPPPPPCHCSNPTWCKPLATPLPDREVFVFHTQGHGDDWQYFDWSQITTVAFYGPMVDALRCKAHSVGARMVMPIGYPTPQLTNATYRAEWAAEQVATMVAQGADGLNVDYENALPKGSAAVQGLTAVMQELRSRMRVANPAAQLTFDAPVRPTYEGRFYDYNGLAAASDFLFVMCYDLNDYNDPPADNDASLANSPLWVVQKGLQEFQAIGVVNTSLVMGVPWYGYDYLCLPGSTPPCSNYQVLFSSQIPFAQIQTILHGNTTTGRIWNATEQSPYLDYKENTGLGFTVDRQIWYDDVDSLTLKYKLAASMELRGVGMWTADKLDYTSGGDNTTRAMWSAINTFLQH